MKNSEEAFKLINQRMKDLAWTPYKLHQECSRDKKNPGPSKSTIYRFCNGGETDSLKLGDFFHICAAIGVKLEMIGKVIK